MEEIWEEGLELRPHLTIAQKETCIGGRVISSGIPVEFRNDAADRKASDQY
jgi:hypothetical protein